MLQSKSQIEQLFYTKAQQVWSLPVIQILIEQKFEIYLVGGSVRDFVLTQNISKDLDIEIHHRGYDSPEDLLRSLKDHFKKNHIKFEQLSFGILRIQQGEYEVELSLPRLESYPKKSVYKHDDFSVTLSAHSNLGDSFVRRDFSINAMALKLSAKACCLEDPFDGLRDLNNRELKNVGENFFKDPVRFLRLVRFSLKYDLTIDQGLKKSLSQFNLTQCSDFYLLSEFEKSKHAEFVTLMFELLNESAVDYPKHWKVLSFFSGIKYTEIQRNCFQFWLKYQNDKLSLDQLTELLKFKANFFNDLKNLYQASLLDGLPSINGEAKDLTVEEINKLKNLRTILNGLDEIDFYNITVFNRQELGALAKKLEQVKVTQEEYATVEKTMRWTLPLLKILNPQ